MNVLNQMMSYDKNKKSNEICNYENCNTISEQIIEYPPLSEEKIEQIIKERYEYKDDKTKKFIRKALRVHGDKYDYSNVVYVKAIENVKIKCRVKGHDIFEQSPHSHLNGRGCSVCGGNKKLTLEEFIEKANKVHGDGTYDYSNVEYKNIDTKVCIICNKHEEPYEFLQTPCNHFKGKGCPKCSGRLKLTTEEFIRRAKEIHGDTYDYSKSNYIDIKTKICIICNKHKEPYEFLQLPEDHIRNGSGCPKCKFEKLIKLRTLTLEEFVEKANKKHGIGIYDYSKVNYIDSRTKVEIICSKHGSFWKSPSNHLQGGGCPKCNKNKGEDNIRKFLIEKEIEFEEQKQFSGCRNVLPLRFDFYLPKYNLCIESDGNIHSEKINWNGKMSDEEMEKELKLTQHRDNIKNEFCKSNGIILLRVNNLKAYEEVTEYFQNQGIYYG